MAEYTTAVPEEAHGDIPVGLVVPARLACYVKQAPSAVRLTRRRSSERHGSDRTSQPVDVRLAVADMAAGFLSNSAVGEIGCMIGLWTTTSTAVPAGARCAQVPYACALCLCPLHVQRHLQGAGAQYNGAGGGKALLVMADCCASAFPIGHFAFEASAFASAFGFGAFALEKAGPEKSPLPLASLLTFTLFQTRFDEFVNRYSGIYLQQFAPNSILAIAQKW